MTNEDSSELAKARRRAEAAEKTVDVLKRKVLALYDGTAKVAIQKQVEQAQKRAESIQRRRELSDLRAAELEHHSKRLEQEVAERTLTIRTILDNVAFGFLLVGPELIALEGYSKSCTVLFETPDIAGRRLTELLRLSARDEGNLTLALSQVFDDVLPEAVSLGQARSRFRVGQRTLALEYRLVRAVDGSPAQILVTVNDATALDAAEREAQLNRMVLGIFKQRDAFRAFLVDSFSQLERAKTQIADQTVVRRAVHTLKGNAGCYGMMDLVEAAHRVEAAPTIEAAQISDLEQALHAFLEQYRELLGSVFEDGWVLEIPEERALALSTMTNHASIPPAIRRWAAELPLKPMAELLGPQAALVERVAERLDKSVLFQIEGGDVLVDALALRPVVAILSHLLNNAVSHGIEPRSRRKPKPEMGRLILRISETDREWQIMVHDDGAGIDVAGVVARAIALGAVTREQAEALDAKGQLELIAVDRLSTASEVTPISGRGFGMSAVLAAVQRVGGHVQVATERGSFTAITLHLPKSEFLRDAIAVPSGASPPVDS
ncbi:MAG TPA: ATP-binding protein [Polyangiaceae bacterium]|nr:ATP-binding protein [Polyangiaceae bacterium]